MRACEVAEVALNRKKEAAGRLNRGTLEVGGEAVSRKLGETKRSLAVV